MNILLLLRHAKAVSGSDSLQDFGRSLNDEGRRQANRAGKYLKEQNSGIDLVLSSTAWRARETTELVLRAAGWVTEVRYDQRIYEASRQQLVEVVSEIELDRKGVLLVGHNPGLEELLQRLTDCFKPMTTGTLAQIDLGASEWTKVSDQKGHLDWLVKPNELAGG